MILISLTLSCAILFALAFINQYRLLKTNAQQIKESFIEIDRELQKRNTHIPLLIECSKKILTQERETLKTLTRLRNDIASTLQKASIDPFNFESLSALHGKEKEFQKIYTLFLKLISDQSILCEQPKMIELLKMETHSKNKLQEAIHSYNQTVERFNTTRSSIMGTLTLSLLVHKKATPLLWAKR